MNERKKYIPIDESAEIEDTEELLDEMFEGQSDDDEEED